MGSVSSVRRFGLREEEISTTDLHAAIAFGEYTTVSHLLILPNIDASIPGQDGKTPLETAIEYGRVEIVKLLLKVHTVNPHAVFDVYNRTPLHLACLKGHEAIVELLLATRPKQGIMDILPDDDDDLEPYQSLEGLSLSNNKELEHEDHESSNIKNNKNIETLGTKTSDITLNGGQQSKNELNMDDASKT